MLQLKINESFEFEELAGMSWTQAQAKTETRYCKPHRMQLRSAAGAPTKDPKELARRQAIVDSVIEDVRECDDCEPPNLPTRAMAAWAYLLTRRDEPGLTWEAFIERDLDQVWDALGKARAATAAEDASAPSTKAGDGPSSISSAGSRRRRTTS